MKSSQWWVKGESAPHRRSENQGPSVGLYDCLEQEATRNEQGWTSDGLWDMPRSEKYFFAFLNGYIFYIFISIY
jgi:hypothetical protein